MRSGTTADKWQLSPLGKSGCQHRTCPSEIFQWSGCLSSHFCQLLLRHQKMSILRNFWLPSCWAKRAPCQRFVPRCANSTPESLCGVHGSGKCQGLCGGPTPFTNPRLCHPPVCSLQEEQELR